MAPTVDARLSLTWMSQLSGASQEQFRSAREGGSRTYDSPVPDELEIRRPDLLHLRRLGTVRWWKDDKGYGRIPADDGEVLWAHFSGLAMEGYRTLQKGQRVSFVWNGGIQDHGRHRAEDVRLVNGGIGEWLSR